jgi:hypothetical protein
MTPKKTYSFLNKIMNFDSVSLTRRSVFLGLRGAMALITWRAVIARRAEQSHRNLNAITQCDMSDLSPLMIKILENSEHLSKLQRTPYLTIKSLVPRVKMQAAHLTGLPDLGLTDFEVKVFLDAEIKHNLGEAIGDDFDRIVDSHKRHALPHTEGDCVWAQAQSDFVKSLKTEMLQRCYAKTQWALVKSQLGCL